MHLRYQSSAQKIVQARMWAQGLTIGVLIAAGALGTKERKTLYEVNEQQPQSFLEQLEASARVKPKLEVSAWPSH